MRRFGRWLGRFLLALAAIGVGVWVFGPYEPAPLTSRFDEAAIGADVDAYFKAQESRFDDIVPGTEKRVVWAGERGERRPIVVVYLHGFSATSEEIRPVPDRVAAALGANLVFTRLTGHGRTGEALAKARVTDWVQDTAEALAVARRIGDRVVILATSTGATLAVAAAADAPTRRDLAAMVLVSPNFGINNPLAPLLTWPAARYWLPVLAGRERSFEPRSEAQARFWTTRYPSTAVFPLAALVRAARALDVPAIDVPALFWFSPDDAVVRADLSARVAEDWGGAVTVRHPELSAEDDIYAHVVMGDALSPGQTDHAIREITAWLKETLD